MRQEGRLVGNLQVLMGYIVDNRLLSTSGAHAHGALERVVDPPLEASESTDHDNPGAETLGSNVGNTNLANDLTERLALVGRLSELRNEGISGVGDDGTDNTSEVTRGEGDTELSSLAVSFLGLSENLGVEELDNLLEEEELGHGVGDLVEHCV